MPPSQEPETTRVSRAARRVASAEPAPSLELAGPARTTTLPPLSHKFSDDSSELSELDDSEAETERLDEMLAGLSQDEGVQEDGEEEGDAEDEEGDDTEVSNHDTENGGVESNARNGSIEPNDEELKVHDVADAEPPLTDAEADADAEAESEAEAGSIDASSRRKRVRRSRTTDESADDTSAAIDQSQDDTDTKSSRSRTKGKATPQKTLKGLPSLITHSEEEGPAPAAESDSGVKSDNWSGGKTIKTNGVKRSRSLANEERSEPFKRSRTSLGPNGSVKREKSEGEEYEEQPASAHSGDNETNEHEEPEQADDEHRDEDSGVTETRQKAISLLTEVEIDFAKLRDALRDDKMGRYVAEIEMCADGSHPELDTVYAHILSLREQKINLAKHRRKYQQKSIYRVSHAMRTHLHQQFLKTRADSRFALLLDTTEEWYKVNRERRAMDMLVPNYSYRAPESLEEQIAEHDETAAEVSLLSGISRHVGFPAAPEMKSINEMQLRDDLDALGIP